MEYLLDTVALDLLESIEDNQNEFVISVISLMEVMYLAEKNRIEINLSETLDIINSSSNYAIANLNPDILRVAELTDFYELHDRMILATAKWLGIKIISSDDKFEVVEGIDVVWD